MLKLFAFILFLLSLLFLRMGIKFEDKNAAGYLTKIRLIGVSILLLIGAIALFLAKTN